MSNVEQLMYVKS